MPTVRKRLAVFGSEAADRFKQQLRAALRSDLALSAWGSGGTLTHHHFTYSTMWDGFEVKWTVSLERATRAIDMEVSAPDGVAEAEFGAFVDAFLLKVLDATITGKLERYAVRRLYLYQGTPLDGEYWLPPFRIAPHAVTEALRPGEWVSQVMVIDQSVEAIDRDHAWDLAIDRANSLASRLSLILDIGLRNPPYERVWTTEDSRGHEGSWRQWVPPHEPRFLDSMPKKGSECGAGAWGGNLHSQRDGGRNITLPRETRRVLQLANSATEEVRKAFDGCCRLYQISNTLPHEFVSARVALQVAAVEALAKAVKEPFSRFMQSRSPLIRANPKLLDILYGHVRSAFVHAGDLYFDSERSRPNRFADFEALDRLNEQHAGEAAMRNAIMSWVLSNLPEH